MINLIANAEEEKIEDFHQRWDLQTQCPPFLLIGLGPFAKKHYVNFFKKYSVYPEIVIDLEPNRTQITQFFESQQMEIPLYLVPEGNRDLETLPEKIQKELLYLIHEYKITHAILATEPKAHFAYLDFLIECGVSILVEKPLTAPKGCSYSIASAERVEQHYDWLLKKSQQNKVRVDLQCQRRYHPIYQFLIKEIESFVAEFDIPITYCDVYHCDGMWNMPDEFIFRENHPYKYGYGKLMHSGYHFVDLLALLLETCYKVCSKKPDEGAIYAVPSSPADFLHLFNEDDYERFFKDSNYESIFSNQEQLGFEHFGELDFFSLIQLFQNGKRLTTCNLNLLQTGFSRRAWNSLPEDTYKGNGRVRHERINLQFGHLFNIQIHSYIAEESKGKTDPHSIDPGGARHFDIYLFRNSQLIGGEPFRRLRSDDFTSNLDNSFNETSREECLRRFLLNRPSLSSLHDHQFGIKILSQALQAMSKHNGNQTFSIPKSYFTTMEGII